MKTRRFILTVTSENANYAEGSDAYWSSMHEETLKEAVKTRFSNSLLQDAAIDSIEEAF